MCFCLGINSGTYVDLEGVTPAKVGCRQPNDTTGPTFKFGIVRHPRQRRTSAWTMGVEESQVTGIQTNACSQYMQLTRATHETMVYLHDFPCGTPGNKVEVVVPPAFASAGAPPAHDPPSRLGGRV